MYAKLNNNGVILSDMCEEGYKPLIRAIIPDIDDTDELEYVYNDNGDCIIEEVIIHQGRAAVHQEIEELKQQLAADDYKVVKCYEASLTGEPLPYDMNTLHSTRQELRERINELENQLSS